MQYWVSLSDQLKWVPSLSKLCLRLQGLSFGSRERLEYENITNLSILASLISTVQHLPGIYFERTLPMKEDDDYDG